jgi:hypothetical protein
MGRSFPKSLGADSNVAARSSVPSAFRLQGRLLSSRTGIHGCITQRSQVSIAAG